MATKKEQLEALIKFIDSLVADPGNKEDFTDKLKERFGRVAEFKENKNPIRSNKIDAIYEYCIEQIARADAHSFYNGFCIPEIIPQLEEDFVKMEHWRRRANVAEFCLALYEQYECIVNRLGADSRLNDIFLKLITYHSYTDGVSYSRKPAKSEYPMYKLIFWASNEAEGVKRPLVSQYAMDKFRAILYLCYYGALMKPEDYHPFKKSCALIEDLYKVRCTNHRGNVANDREQSAIDRVNMQPIKFELRMLGHLSDFIEQINKHYPEISHLKEYADTLPLKKYAASGLKIVGNIDLSKFR